MYLKHKKHLKEYEKFKLKHLADYFVGCPVRTLKQYLIKTKCPDRIPQLFRKLGKNSPLPATAISRNLVNTIRTAYSSQSGQVPLTGQVKGHDVRAVAASLQMRNFPSWTALRSSFGWTTPSVFITHYGKGESALNKIVNNLRS